MYDEGRGRHEIIGGRRSSQFSFPTQHRVVAGNLMMALAPVARPRGLFLPGVGVVLSEHDVVVPELMFIERERAASTRDDDYIRVVPDFIVEVIHPEWRELYEVTKVGLYERFGVREYWLVDPGQQRVHVYGRDDEPLESSDTLTSRFFPGLTIAVKDLW